MSGAPRVTPDALLDAANWLNAYEAEDRDRARAPDEAYDGDDEFAATLYAVADWLTDQAATRQADAENRRLARALTKREGRKVTPKQAREALAEWERKKNGAAT